MSTDPTAILYYGIKLPESVKDRLNDYDSGQDYHEMNSAWKEEQGPKQPEDNKQGTYREKYRDELAKWSKTERFIEIHWSGTEHVKTFYIEICCLKKEVEYDQQSFLDLWGMIEVEKEIRYSKALKEFCAKFSLPYEEPKWYLASLYF